MVKNGRRRGYENWEDKVEARRKSQRESKRRIRAQEKIEKLTPWDNEKIVQKVHRALDKEIKPFKDTFAFHVADHISQASRLGILVMGVDVSVMLMYDRLSSVLHIMCSMLQHFLLCPCISISRL